MIDYDETKSQPINRWMVWEAYGKVKANKGSAGIVNMGWEYLEKHQYAELYKLWNRMASGSYFPQAVKRVAIPKKGGGQRNLGVPTILDRIAQEVVRTHLERIVEPRFHNSSFPRTDAESSEILLSRKMGAAVCRKVAQSRHLSKRRNNYPHQAGNTAGRCYQSVVSQYLFACGL